jgi:hypothetical protein
MTSIREGDITFGFPPAFRVVKFDDWVFYKSQFQSACGGCKAVDFVVCDGIECLWLIEVKDYRRHERTKLIDLADEIAAKTRDSLAALVAGKCNANDLGEKAFARKCLRCERLRVVLHLEQPVKPSRLFPRAIDCANVKQRLKQRIKPIDAHPLVVETTRMDGTEWTARLGP